MDKYQKKEFLLDLMKAGQKFNDGTKNIVSEFCDGAMTGLTESFDKEGEIDMDVYNQLKETPIDELIKQMEEVDPDSQLFDRIFHNVGYLMSCLGEVEPVTHQGQTIDPKMFSEKYEELKTQFEEYGKTQDIKNL